MGHRREINAFMGLHFFFPALSSLLECQSQIYSCQNVFPIPKSNSYTCKLQNCTRGKTHLHLLLCICTSPCFNISAVFGIDSLALFQKHDLETHNSAFTPNDLNIIIIKMVTLKNSTIVTLKNSIILDNKINLSPLSITYQRDPSLGFSFIKEVYKICSYQKRVWHLAWAPGHM